MTNLNAEYFFLLRDRDERNPIPTPDEDTVEKPFESEILPPHGKPLVFTSGGYELQRSQGLVPIDPPPPILFYGSSPLVKETIRKALLPLRLPDLAIQPAIFIDHKGGWHEDYWFLTFLKVFDCWDRDKSTWDPDPSVLDGVVMHNVYAYSLDAKAVSKVPLKSRLLFKMGGTSDGFKVVHKSIAQHFRVAGAVLVPIADYGVTWPEADE